MAGKKKDIILQDGNQGKHRVTKRGPALSNPMFTLVTGIVGRWRAVCVTALQRPNSDAAAIRIVVVFLFLVVDVYQAWCGPCKTTVSLFRKIKNELGDDLLQFAVAEADSIDALEKYRGKCEPTFLFFAGGDLVAVVRGANAPLLQKTIIEQLEAEKKVINHGLDRNVIKDEALMEEEEEELSIPAQTDDDELVPSGKSYTVAIIKPDAVAHGKADEIIMKIQEAGFEILANEEKTMTESEARDFYKHRAGEEKFQELVQFMSSGPSHVLIIAKSGEDDVIPTWREFIGPTDVEVAKKEKPER
ncbi:unnamed protein product [Ranitomeya imitator]|uniref:Thioredoxin domain-containing protein n=1 Tax=Ranitomeya imitator TaxID=111125 RepID=A0ABN9M274_9NEOB|nr:unnamed protein product [Ranitomeya imitator]